MFFFIKTTGRAMVTTHIIVHNYLILETKSSFSNISFIPHDDTCFGHMKVQKINSKEMVPVTV